jgi:arylsulfatase A-like enzyme
MKAGSPLLLALAALINASFGFAVDVRASSSPVSARPNIVVILADDLGYGDPGCYNPQSKIPTPFIDQLAAQGIRLTDAHAAAAVCSPSRYGLLTGQYPWRTRPGGSALGPWAAPIIARDRLTLPAMLKQAGYATACIGKWHLGWQWPTRDGGRPRTAADFSSNVDFTRAIVEGPTTRGFDYYFGTCVPNYPPYCFIENDRTVGIPSENTDDFETPGPKLPGWNQEEILPELTRRTVRYLEAAAKSGQPFFLYFALTSPHHPLLPTAEFRGKSGAGEYGDYVMQTDWTIGQVMAALDRTQLAERTLVIFTSDNGPEITRKNNRYNKVVMAVGAYDRVREYGHFSMGAWRGIKYEAWEGGHRMPLIARWPGRIQPGAVSGELVCLTDLMATCAAAVGTKLPANAGEDSYNALPVLLGGTALRDSAVLASSSKPLAVRRGDWVWIDSNRPINPEPDWWQKLRGYPAEAEGEQLFNLRDDPSQRVNHVKDHPQKAREFRAWLDGVKATGRSPRPTNDNQP